MPFVSRFSIRTAAAWIFFALLWFGLWRELSSEWSVNDQYSYGWFVPFFVIMLFWLRFEDRPKPDTGNRKAERKIAIVLAIIALLLLFPLRLFEIGNPDWRPLSWLHAISVVAITLICLWSIGGAAWLKHFAFPVAFTLIAVPWVTPIEQPIVQGLMRVVAAIASEAVTLFGIPAHFQGNLIRIPDGVVGVNEACSGVRSLQTSLMIGLLFGELKRLSILHRLVLIAGAVAIAFIGNVLRAFFLVWIAATQNVAAANRWHDFAGYGIVVLVFIGSLALAAILGDTKGRIKKDEGRNEIVAEKFSYFLVPTFYFAAATVWLVISELAAASWYRAHERDLSQMTRWEIRWPREAVNFHEIKIDEDVRRALRFDRGQAASWTVSAANSATESASVKPLNCTLFFFRWNPGKNSALLANLHRPDVCLPSTGWNQTSDAGIENFPVTEKFSLPFRRFKFRHGITGQPTEQTAHAFYCLWEDQLSASRLESSLPTMSGSASAWSRSERVRAVLEGRRHLGQQVLELVIQGRGGLNEEQVEAEFARIVPNVVKIESEK